MRIEDYRFGEIVIDDKSYTTDVIVYPDKVDSNWWRREGHELRVEDIEEVIKEKPDLIIVGTGSPGFMKVLPQTSQRLKEEGIELVVKPTHEACKIFNKLESTKKVVACLHLTC